MERGQVCAIFCEVAATISVVMFIMLITTRTIFCCIGCMVQWGHILLCEITMILLYVNMYVNDGSICWFVKELVTFIVKNQLWC